MAEREVDYLLIGGGLASGNCSRWLRESGADGSILLVGREPEFPYNRPPCSKEYLRFTAQDGAEEHCQMGAMSLFHQRIFDWLDDAMAGIASLDQDRLLRFSK